MELIEISVPYTGTNFLAKLFTDCGFQRVGMQEQVHGNPDILRVAHCIKPTQIDPALTHVRQGKPLVIPCRHPFLVEESYLRKGEGGYQPILVDAFETLITEFAPLTDLILCVDSLKREDQLEHIKSSLDLQLKTDWGVIGSQSTTYGLNLSDLNPSKAVLDLLNRHKSFFSRFYELV